MEGIIRFIQKYKVFLVLALIFIFLFILTILSEGTYGGADDYVHYRIARYAFKYPYFFLDHWGKPLFTIFASPFAQFGFLGVKLFNVFVGIFTCYFTCLICNELKLKTSLLSILLLCFAPVYLTMLLSGMTEILFSFILIVSVYLAWRDKLLLSAIIISFIPFVRNEGVIFFPCFLLYYLLKRKYWALPLIFTGLIFYSFVGWKYYGDFFWFINKMPYFGASKIYGSGELLHFVKNNRIIFGKPLALLSLIGFIVFLFPLRNLKKDQQTESLFIKELLLIVVPFLTYYAAHSVLWWKGWNSLGLTRVMAGIVPLAAILGAQGLDFIYNYVAKFKWIAIVLGLGILIFIIKTPFKYFQFPVPLGKNEQIINQAAIWVNKNGLDKNRVYYFDPYYCFFRNLDPLDQSKTWERLPDIIHPSNEIEPGCIIIWDAHFGPNEGRIALEKLLNDSLMQLLNIYRPITPYTVLGGNTYEVCVFKRLANPVNPSTNIKKYTELENLIKTD